MDRLLRHLGLAKAGALWGVFLLAFGVGCADDLYAPCQLNPTSPDPAQAYCGSDEGTLRSCVVDNYINCDTRSCGRYQSSEPFCTKVCTDTADCPSGQCIELVFQSGKKYCVQDETL